MEDITACYEAFKQRRLQALKADGASDLRQTAHELISQGLSLDTRLLLINKAAIFFMQFPDGKPYALIQYEVNKLAEIGQAANGKKLVELCDRIYGITGFDTVWVRGVDLLCRSIYENGQWRHERCYA